MESDVNVISEHRRPFLKIRIIIIIIIFKKQ